MSTKRIAVIDGHPDPIPDRFVHALAASYLDGASAAGHSVRRIIVAELQFCPIRTQKEWESGLPSPAIKTAQDAIGWANHLLIVYPLWLGDVPSIFKAFLEQVFRPGFAFRPRPGRFPEKRLVGRSARILVTMGMPALLYRTVYGSHSLKSLERNILKIVGISPVRHHLISSVEASARARDDWLKKLYALGRAGT